MKINKSTVIPAIFFFVVSFLTVLEGFRVRKNLTFLDYLSPLRPDNYLLLLAGAIATLAVLFLVKDIFLSSHYTISKSKTRITDVIITLAIFIGYILSVEWLGYLLTTFLFYFFFLRWVGRYSYVKTVIISILVTVGYHLVFVEGFDMVLPTGIIEGLFKAL